MNAVVKPLAAKRSADEKDDLEVTPRGALKKSSKDILSNDMAKSVLKEFVRIERDRVRRK